jgi:nucleoside-diphosphate-sugar epimerase
MTDVLVTGGAGFIGSALVRQLLDKGYAVRVLDDYSRGVPERLKDIADKIEMIDGDVRKVEDVDKAVEGMEIVLHLAAVNGTENFYKNPERVLEVGVKGTINTMDAAVKHGCKRYLLASSSEVYQQPTECPTKESERIIVPDVHNPRFSYSGSKIIGELLALHYLAKTNMDVVIFRPHNIYGPDMGNEHVVPQFATKLRELKSEKFPIQGDGSETRAFCFISDAVEEIILLMEKGKAGEIYNVGNDGEEVAIKDLALAMAKVLGKEIEIVPGELQKGGTNRRCPDMGKTMALGFEPKVSLEEGLKLCV